MMHGSTLQRIGAESFTDILIEKGYPRSKGLELILITCSGKRILGEDGQWLANILQSNVRAAKGKVVVQKNGVPWVTVKRDNGTESTYKQDIFDLMGDILFDQLADGWVLFTPQPEETLKIVKRDAKRQNWRALDMLRSMDRLADVKGKAPEPEDIDKLHERVSAIVSETRERLDELEAMKGQADNEKLRTYREVVDNMDGLLNWVEPEIDQLAEEWAEKNGMTVTRYLLDQKITPEEVSDSGSDEENGWDLDFSIDFSSDDDSAGASNDNTTQAKTKGPESATEAQTKLKRSLSLPPTIQRVINTPQDQIADGRVLRDLMNGFNDLNLTEGDEITLTVEYGDPDEDAYAKTLLFMDGEEVQQYQALIMANVDKNFEIKIILSEAKFQGGQKRVPQLIATLNHEWELHGRQYALNIHKLKNQEMPDEYIGHAQFFEPGIQDIDRAMAIGIAEANEDDKAAVLADYLKDAYDHTGFTQTGWIENDNDTALYFHQNLVETKNSWKILKMLQPQHDNQKAYEVLVDAVMSALDDAYFDQVDPDVTAQDISFLIQQPKEFYDRLIAAYSTTIPSNGPDDAYYVSREQIRTEHLHKVLLSVPGFLNAIKTMEAIDNDDPNPRASAMRELGYAQD